MSTDRLTAARAQLAALADRLSAPLVRRSPDERIPPDHSHANMTKRTLVALGEELIEAATEAATAKVAAAEAAALASVSKP